MMTKEITMLLLLLMIMIRRSVMMMMMTRRMMKKMTTTMMMTRTMTMTMIRNSKIVYLFTDCLSKMEKRDEKR